jgi:hypothetical protein
VLEKRCWVWYTSARKLDGHTLYSASHLPGRGFARAVVACFDTPHASSDGGTILLKSVDTHLGLTKRLARCLVDERQPDQRRECHEILPPESAHRCARPPRPRSSDRNPDPIHQVLDRARNTSLGPARTATRAPVCTANPATASPITSHSPVCTPTRSSTPRSLAVGGGPVDQGPLGNARVRP